MKSVIVVSDLHIGSNAGLCPYGGLGLPDSNTYKQNKFQETTWKYWENFWFKWVPKTIGKSKKVIVVINGDIIDGFHHDTVNIMSNSVTYQEFAAEQILKELDFYDSVYVVRGTEAHSDKGGASEEKIARTIGAQLLENGQYSDYQIPIDVDDVPFNFAHHIGVTSSAAYETSAPMRELVAALVEASQWGRRMPRVVVRSHRHRFVPISIPSIHGRIRCVITPGWQLKTPFVERTDRMRMPHIGGIVFKVEDDQCQEIEKIYPLPQSKAIKI
ncbi:MAG: hypothetical protein PHV98_00785 [Candidatus Omnitrophica bacterium]|nr:hypothetical protein [Candidatus Omnitrophota bacterium]